MSILLANGERLRGGDTSPVEFLESWAECNEVDVKGQAEERPGRWVCRALCICVFR